MTVNEKGFRGVALAPFPAGCRIYDPARGRHLQIPGMEDQIKTISSVLTVVDGRGRTEFTWRDRRMSAFARIKGDGGNLFRLIASFP